MIENFLASWSLFQNTYLAGWLIAVLLSLVGVLVVARDQIFIGAAVTQASTLGVAVAMWTGWITGASQHSLGSAHSFIESEVFVAVTAVLFSVLAAMVTARGGGPGRETHEAITGWVFLLSASLAILLMSRSPHGLEQIHRLLASSIIGATRADVWVFGALVLATALFVAANRSRLLLFVMDPPMAAASGVRTGLWSVVLAMWLGLVVGLSIRVSGMLYTFGCLVLPPLVAKSLAREVSPLFWLAPAVALTSGFVAFVIANHHDLPPAQMAVALLGVLLAGAWLYRSIRPEAS